MRHIQKRIICFFKQEEGVTAVECALMLALVVVICIVALNTVQPKAIAVDEPVVIIQDR